jgi:DNA-binding transcriptional LysR family regulator
VSKLLAHIETSLGLKLFHRVGGKLAPTAAALTLFEEIKQVYDAALKVDQFVDNLVQSPSGSINISCSPSLGLSVVPKVINIFLQKFPDTKIHFHTTLIQDVPIELLSGKIDLAVTVLPVEGPNLQSEPLIQGRMVCALPEGHALARLGCLSLSDLMDERLILYSRTIPFGQLLLAAFQRYGCNVVPIIDVPRAELACSLVRQGVGIAIVDQFSVADGAWSGLVVRPLAQEIPIVVSLIRSKFDRPSAEVEHFITVLKAQIK